MKPLYILIVLAAIVVISVSVMAFVPTGGYTLIASIEVSAGYPPKITKLTGGWAKSTTLGTIRMPTLGVIQEPVTFKGTAEAICENLPAMEKTWTTTVTQYAKGVVRVDLEKGVPTGTRCTINVQITESSFVPYDSSIKYASAISPAE